LQDFVRKHFKEEEGNCHNPFLDYSPIQIFSLFKKNTKKSKNIIKKYNSEKRMPKRLKKWSKIG
jgi:hypothetical protein